MLAWRSETHGGIDRRLVRTGTLKLAVADLGAARPLAVVRHRSVAGRRRWSLIVEALRSRELTFSRNLAFSALVLIAAFVVLPRIVFGSAYADMRLVPYMIAVAAARDPLPGRDRSARWPDGSRSPGWPAVLRRRLGGNTVSLAMAAERPAGEARRARSRADRRARRARLVGMPCGMAGRCRATAIWARW